MEYSDNYYDSTSTTSRSKPQESKYTPSFSVFDRGWICPKCGAANAPWVTQCPCSFQGEEIKIKYESTCC